MKSNTLKDLVRRIKYETGDTVAEIAKKIGYSRSHLTTEINKGENDHIKNAILRAYNMIEQNVGLITMTAGDRIRELQRDKEMLSESILLSLAVLKEGQIGLAATISAGMQELLRVSSLLQGKPVEELRQNAGIIADAMTSSLKKQGKGAGNQRRKRVRA